MDNEPKMKIDPHAYAENFIAEDPFKTYARARGVEIGAHDVTPGVGAYLKHLAFTLSAQSVVEIGTGSGRVYPIDKYIDVEESQVNVGLPYKQINFNFFS